MFSLYLHHHRAWVSSQLADALTVILVLSQHALLLPVLVHHVRYHMCLKTLDEKMGYIFKDRSLLQVFYIARGKFTLICIYN